MGAEAGLKTAELNDIFAMVGKAIYHPILESELSNLFKTMLINFFGIYKLVRRLADLKQVSMKHSLHLHPSSSPQIINLMTEVSQKTASLERWKDKSWSVVTMSFPYLKIHVFVLGSCKPLISLDTISKFIQKRFRWSEWPNKYLLKKVELLWQYRCESLNGK